MEALNIIWCCLGIILFLLLIFNILYDIFYRTEPITVYTSKKKDIDKKKQKDIDTLDSEDLFDMGIAGMDEYIEIINNKVLAIRTLDQKTIDSLGVRPPKGILLHGEPGNGKTILASSIGKILNCEKPIIVSGPQILSKWIGESESNIRQLFDGAKNDPNSLHLIIFDEFDSIGGARNSEGDVYGTKNNIVNQLLAMMDGPEALDNIIVIAITNRIDSLDTALLRAGRFEVHIEVKKPKLQQRYDILIAKTNKLSNNGFLDKNVDFEELARLTENYSGADLEGLINRTVGDLIYTKIENKKKNNNLNEKITQEDFIKNLKIPEVSKKKTENNMLLELLKNNPLVF